MERNNRLVFSRSNTTMKRKFDEAISILEYSVMLVELFELEEFNNVIAGQLRLMLGETKHTRIKREKVTIDQSLIKKINPHPKLYPLKDCIQIGIDGLAHLPEEFFDYTEQRINLVAWRNQVIFKNRMEGQLHEMTIIDFIKETADKIGGAQADSRLPYKSLIAEEHTKILLMAITKGLFKSIGRDYSQHSTMNLSSIREKIEQTKAIE
ncbi:hypothetical protein GW626_03715 [Peribacillus muralis]|uniref:hypothetical protein n=1 Tax=Peribacillus muralis TaxID=264697 RepID=UPI001F4E879D|nr:hypothetical protein [Peribacillus muralis]MCK1993268.1 hypothetical protein [Peribacillus muralis]MCK2013822.1 hypothetical protein [Peribacillus muralis]